MSPSWLDNLERSLEERLEQFLRSNPSQDQLLREQHLQDRQRDLHNRRGQQQLQARELRRQLLTLAEQVQAWTQRGEKARRAGALELAQRAGWRWLRRWHDPEDDLSLHLLEPTD